MKRMAILSLFFLFLSCDKGSTLPPEGLVLEPVEIKVGQSVTIDGGQLTFQFESVPDDSRCPELAECFWAGNAIVVLRFSDRQGTLNTSLEPRGVRYGAYEIKLISLTPYPRFPVQIPKDSYVAKLEVRKK